MKALPPLFVMALIALGQSARAQWTVTNLHPTGAVQSLAQSANGALQAGSATFPGGLSRAFVWNGAAASGTEFGVGRIYGMDGAEQVGHGGSHALLWSSVPYSWIDLHPAVAGITASALRSISGSKQAGYTIVSPNLSRAAVWSGSAASYVNLNPSGSAHSMAFAANGDFQAGYAFIGGVYRASLWRGTASSWVSLHPDGLPYSTAWAMSATKQGGHVVIGSQPKASLWSGTPASWTNLHPAGQASSEVLGMMDPYQVGHVNNNAALWVGTAHSWTNLSDFLPVGFSSSEATGLSVYGGMNYITGSGFNMLTGRQEALLWTAPTDFTASGTIILGDSVSSFAVPRSIAYSVLQGTASVASGTITAGGSSNIFNITMPTGIAGPVQLVLDGSSWLKREVNVNLAGVAQNLGTINMQNGDVDASGEVDAADIDAVISDFGDTNSLDTDVDVSGEVDAADIDIVIANFGGVDD